MEQFNTIEKADLKESDLTKYRHIPLHVIAADPEGQTKVLNALRWMEEQIDRA
ncbi:hypothetical protein [Bradyrhizobium liaoningense]|uniref:hypothetical protein n=1 Tax=Bradyrhizobium liaoningense TaxID=43992 RepID=UPI0004AF6112|nr:hypothetical protein [Bradyrhizobium liaoningense]